MSPLSGSSSPASIRSAVVFPQPDGPRRTSSSRSGMSSDSPRTAAASVDCAANCFQTSSYSTFAIGLQTLRAVHQAADHQPPRAEEDGNDRQQVEDAHRGDRAVLALGVAALRPHRLVERERHGLEALLSMRMTTMSTSAQ